MSSGILEHDKGLSAQDIVPWHRSPNWKVYKEAGVPIETVVEECFPWTVTVEQAKRHRPLTDEELLNIQEKNLFIYDDEGNLDKLASIRAVLANAQSAQNVPDTFHVIRDDTDMVLGTTGKRFAPLQNADAALLFKDIVDDSDILIDTAGSLWNGKKIFIACKLPETMTVGGESREGIETYLILTNAHDGSGALCIAIVPIRVVCQNTLSWALASALRSFKVKHTDTILNRAMDARRVLELGWKATEAVIAEMDAFSQFSWTDKDMEQLLALTNPVAEDEGRARTTAEGVHNDIFAIYRGEKYGQGHIQGTAYGAMMACSAYSDHQAIFRNTETSSVAENQMRVLALNGGGPLVQKAYPLIRGRVAGNSWNKLAKATELAAA